MKKLLTAILSLAMVAATGVPALAAEINNGGDTSIPVSGKYHAAAAASEIVSVDIAWDEMSFTYTAPSEGTWNPGTHAYDGAAEGGWAWSNATEAQAAPLITVTNHSNVGVKASFAFATGIENLNGSFAKNSLVLATADGTSAANAPRNATAFSVDGSGIDANQTLGTITVTVAKDDTQHISTAEELLATAKKNRKVYARLQH